MGLKTLQNCDMEKPSEHLLWGLINVPGIGQSGSGIPVAWGELISEHLFELGFRHNPDLQTKKFIRPPRGPQTSYNNACSWAPMDTEEPEVFRVPDTKLFTVHERNALIEQLYANGDIPDPREAMNVASVVDSD